MKTGMALLHDRPVAQTAVIDLLRSLDLTKPVHSLGLLLAHAGSVWLLTLSTAAGFHRGKLKESHRAGLLVIQWRRLSGKEQQPKLTLWVGVWGRGPCSNCYKIYWSHRRNDTRNQFKQKCLHLSSSYCMTQKVVMFLLVSVFICL